MFTLRLGWLNCETRHIIILRANPVHKHICCIICPKHNQKYHSQTQTLVSSYVVMAVLRVWSRAASATLGDTCGTRHGPGRKWRGNRGVCILQHLEDPLVASLIPRLYSAASLSCSPVNSWGGGLEMRLYIRQLDIHRNSTRVCHLSRYGSVVFDKQQPKPSTVLQYS